MTAPRRVRTLWSVPADVKDIDWPPWVGPVVAAAVGGLRTLVDHAGTGFLVETRDPADYAAYIAEILDHPRLARDMSARAAQRARRYTWSTAAGELRRLYATLTERQLVDCP